jgi:hypothetical protein
MILGVIAVLLGALFGCVYSLSREMRVRNALEQLVRMLIAEMYRLKLPRVAS